MTAEEKKYLWLEPATAWGAFLILLICYWLTVAPTVSFWDCPEYVSGAWLLEIGHPPGNPTWMLVERIVTMLAPSGEYAALAVNLSSGLFTAFAGFFLAKTIFRAGLWVLLKLPRKRIPAPVCAAGGALVGALAFGLCDSAWYSAVEAEVYAMSIFLTALCVWLMTKWAGTRSRRDSWRLLVLLAYLFGLSIGVHQLNLLCIPALAMIWAIRRGIRTPGRMAIIFLLSLVAVGCVLAGMMPSSISLAAEFELIAVNTFHLPRLWGVAAYIALLGASLLLALYATARFNNRGAMAAACFPAIFLSGIFILSDAFLAGAAISAVVAALMVKGHNFEARRLALCMWMLTMLLVGYSSYALIPIRGDIPSPANPSMPGNPFSFASYQSREQYGSAPLLYGQTPYSKLMYEESYDSDGNPYYRKYATLPVHSYIVPKEKGARMNHALDSTLNASNAALIERPGDAYLVKGVKLRNITTPELNMWFPRITSRNPDDIESYASWLGMDTSNMTRVAISEAFDSLGRAVPKADADGHRTSPIGYRPTYLQNLQWFAAYQTGYMYWRYLLWNFSGRQNDRPSQGGAQYGNFITGFPAIDNAMLGPQEMLPPSVGRENPGRNRYFMLPLILGIIGMCWLLGARRRGMELCSINAVLFIMTGIAITVYLNQAPGEPRERDYSFLGSYWAYALWIGFGAIAIARMLKSKWGFLIGLAVVAWMGIENFDDHDRSNRYAARNLTYNILNSLEPNAIIFVSADNLTFPLWYAQEVEGIRRDVRVVNLSYLATPIYAANVMRPWREAEAVPTTLTREDLIWDLFQRVKLPAYSPDTLDAVEALKLMKASDTPAFPCRYVRLKVATDSTAVYDLKKMARGDGVDFGNLMIFDIVATSAASPASRPIYWLDALGSAKMIGLQPFTSRWIMGNRFGIEHPDSVDAKILGSIDKFIAPNPLDRHVYMDRTPIVQLMQQRGAMTAVAERFLMRGKVEQAALALSKADRLFGEHPDSYGSIIVADTTYIVRRKMASLMLSTADSMQARIRQGRVNDIRTRRLYETRIAELRARGRMLSDHADRYQRQWEEFRDALPPRLVGKMAPAY